MVLPLSRTSSKSAITREKEGKWIQQEERIEELHLGYTSTVFPTVSFFPRLGIAMVR
jgi:hypothetical protein